MASQAPTPSLPSKPSAGSLPYTPAHASSSKSPTRPPLRRRYVALTATVNFTLPSRRGRAFFDTSHYPLPPCRQAPEPAVSIPRGLLVLFCALFSERTLPPIDPSHSSPDSAGSPASRLSLTRLRGHSYTVLPAPCLHHSLNRRTVTLIPSRRCQHRAS